MEAEIAALISSGATTLIGLMATDAWSQAKRSASALLARSNSQNLDHIESELEETRTQLLAAREDGDVDLESDLQGEWRSRLRRAVTSDPALVPELEAFIREYGEGSSGADQSHIRIVGNARDNARIYQQGHGVQYNR